MLWVDASSDLVLRETYAKHAKHLGLISSSANDQHAAIDSVKDWLTDHKKGDWLLVIDNADKLDEVDIQAFIPPTNKGSVVITSRDSQAGVFGPAIELGEMDSRDAYILLLRRAAIHQPCPADEAAAVEITKSLGYLALAIEHAGAYIQSVGGSLRDYQQQFQSNKRSTLDRSPRVSMHKDSVFKTFSLSFEAIKERNSAASGLLCFLGFLDAGAVSEELLLSSDATITAFKPTVIADHAEFLHAVQELLSFSLIRTRLEDGRRSISLHPLVHYLTRARLKVENQWVWKEKTVRWLLQSAQVTAADTAFFPHVREQMKQLTEFTDHPADSQIRRWIYMVLGQLQHYYRVVWHNHGAMDELHTYAGMVLKVLEEDLEDVTDCSAACTYKVVDIQLNTVQYVNSNQTSDQVLWRYLLKRMTTAAVSALERASNSNEDDHTVDNPTGTVRALQGNFDAKRDGLLNMCTLTTAIVQDINASPGATGKMVQEDTDPIEGTNSLEEKRLYTTPVKDRQEKTERDSAAAGSSIFVATRKEAGSGDMLLHQQIPAVSDPQVTGSQGGGPSTMVNPTYGDGYFKPKYLSHVFLSTKSPVHVKCLINCLNLLITTYYSQKRTAEADILRSYSMLPLDPSRQVDLQLQETVPQLIIEAGRLAGQGDLESMLDVYQKIITTGDSSGQEIFSVALDYVIILNKLERPEVAEQVIKQIFYRTQSAQLQEQEIARQWQRGYVWIKKTMAVAQRLQGDVEASHQTLLLTLQTSQSFFGPNSLSSLHAAHLLHMHYREERGTHSPQSETEAKWYAEQFSMIFEQLYGVDGQRQVVGEQGLQMGMILWAQGALEEATHVFDSFARLAARAMGEGHQLTKKARRAEVVARKEVRDSWLLTAIFRKFLISRDMIHSSCIASKRQC